MKPVLLCVFEDCSFETADVHARDASFVRKFVDRASKPLAGHVIVFVEDDVDPSDLHCALTELLGEDTTVEEQVEALVTVSLDSGDLRRAVYAARAERQRERSETESTSAGSLREFIEDDAEVEDSSEEEQPSPRKRARVRARRALIGQRRLVTSEDDG
jgi:hypothetical protein